MILAYLLLVREIKQIKASIKILIPFVMFML